MRIMIPTCVFSLSASSLLFLLYVVCLLQDIQCDAVNVPNGMAKITNRNGLELSIVCDPDHTIMGGDATLTCVCMNNETPEENSETEGKLNTMFRKGT